MEKLRVAIAGTGAAAKEFIEAIPEEHPIFKIEEFYGRSAAGRKLGSLEFMADVSPRLAEMTVKPFPRTPEEVNKSIDVFFSAVAGSKDDMRAIEGVLASQKPTFSTTAAWRYEDDVDIILTGVNSHLVSGVERQRKKRGWKGFILPGPNCTVVGPIISLKALGINPDMIESIYAASDQAISGAGRDAVLAYRRQKAGEVGTYDKTNPQFDRNVRSKIDGEQEKVRKEMKKICGLDFKITPQCLRVPVEDGHTVIMFVRTKKPITVEQAKANAERFSEECKQRYGKLYSSPEKTIEFSPNYGPQAFFDVEKYGGMCTFIGQLAELEGENGLTWIVLTHNLKIGAGKDRVRLAEYMYSMGLLK